MWSVSSTSPRYADTSAAGASTPSGTLDAGTAEQSVNALFARDIRSPDWEKDALSLFRTIRRAGIALDGVVTADQLKTLAQSECRKLVSFLVRSDQTMAPRLRAFSPEPKIERAIRKGEGRPYLSSHGHDVGELNAKAEVVRNGRRNNVVCDHLSLMYLVSTRDSDTERKPDWDHFKTVEAIAAYAGGHEVEEARAQLLAPRSLHVLPNSEFGSFLTTQFQELRASFDRLSEGPAREEGATSYFEIFTTCHTMALTLSVKQGEDGPEFVVRLYDPNFTATHIRASTLDPQGFERHRMSDYLDRGVTGAEDRFALYVRGDDVQGDDAILTIRDADLRDREPQQPLCHRSAKIKPGAALAFHLLATGAAQSFAAMWGEFRLTPRSELETYTVLRAWSGALALPGAAMAFHDGHAGTVGVFASAVLETGLLQEAKAKLLAAASHTNIPGLWTALFRGQTDVVGAFLNAVLPSDLAPDLKLGLLSATGAGGHPGLFTAMLLGHAETAKVFIAAVLDSSLPEQEKALLLSGRGEQGVAALAAALLKGHTAVIKFFVGAVLTSNLPDAQKSELLAAKYHSDATEDGVLLPRDTPGVLPAFSSGSTGAVSAFVEAVLASQLPDDAKVQLVAAPAPDRTPAFAIAFAHGHAETVRAVADAVLRSSLPVPQKVELLAARDAQGAPALRAALVDGRAEAIAAYMQAVWTSGLPEMQRLHLLAAIGQDGRPVIEDLLAREDQGALEVYVQAVLDAHLPDATTVRLLSPSSCLEGTPPATLEVFTRTIQDSTLARSHKDTLAAVITRCGVPCTIL